MINASNAAGVADARPGNWVERFAPPALLPYAQLMRLERPIGWWLLLLPCWWGLVLAQTAHGDTRLDLRSAVLFLAGAMVMRGAGCVINDLADRDLDAKVARTRSRPLASGRISVRAALVFLAALLLMGLAILLQFNSYTVLTGLASVPLVLVYPFMKRITNYPQVVLGLAFNWGALVSWTAIHDRLALPALLLYAGGLAWTLAYDTIYAHQDKDDDVLAGIGSTALKFGTATPSWLIVFFGLSLALIDASFWLAGTSLLAHVGVAAAALHAAWQVARFNGDDSSLCLKLFKANRTFGLILLLGLLLDFFLS